MTKPKKKPAPKPRKDLSQTALAVVEKAIGGKLANNRRRSS
jgi:hypothetical protein